MTTMRDRVSLNDQEAAFRQVLLEKLGSDLLGNPQLAELANQTIEANLRQAAPADGDAGSDGGLSDLIGLGDSSPAEVTGAGIDFVVQSYDDQVTSERILATADLYYLYMHERLGIFRVLDKLKSLFEGGSLRVSSGPGASALYRYDRQNILRYQRGDRWRAYRRVFGSPNIPLGTDSRPNLEFNGLFTHFITEVARFWRDKRISEVIRHRANDPSYGSIAVVRRAGLDLRNNLKNSSYGHIHILAIEANLALNDAFKVLAAADILRQFGAESAWDVVELVLWQYFHESVNASTMNRMAVSGRDILIWLANPYILNTTQVQFEGFLQTIVGPAEEWITSKEGMRISRPTPPSRNLYMPGPPPSRAPRAADQRQWAAAQSGPWDDGA
jgi:hypothetical protein